jgi:transposase-like protein
MPLSMRRNHYSDEFKREAVKALLKSEKPVVEMALVLGVEQSMLHRWKSKFAPKPADFSQRPVSLRGESDEIRALKSEIASLKATVRRLRDIFTKCMGDRYETPDLDGLDQNKLLSIADPQRETR